MPSRCIFLFRALRACSTLLSRTNTCKCFPIVLLSLLWSGDPDDFRVTRPMASMSVRAQEEDDIISNSIAIIRIVRPLRSGTQQGRPGGGCGRFSIMRRSGFGFLLFAQTPELESFYIDCFFDLIAGEVMGRGLVRSDHPGNSPGTVVLREFAPHRIAGEGA